MNFTKILYAFKYNLYVDINFAGGYGEVSKKVGEKEKENPKPPEPIPKKSIEEIAKAVSYTHLTLPTILLV